MKEELKKALEEGISKFAFEEVVEAIPKITKEMTEIIRNYGILDGKVVVSQVNTFGIKAVISFNGKSIEVILNGATASSLDI